MAPYYYYYYYYFCKKEKKQHSNNFVFELPKDKHLVNPPSPHIYIRMRSTFAIRPGAPSAMVSSFPARFFFSPGF